MHRSSVFASKNKLLNIVLRNFYPWSVINLSLTHAEDTAYTKTCQALLFAWGYRNLVCYLLYPIDPQSPSPSKLPSLLQLIRSLLSKSIWHKKRPQRLKGCSLESGRNSGVFIGAGDRVYWRSKSARRASSASPPRARSPGSSSPARAAPGWWREVPPYRDGGGLRRWMN
jgi:hypothetical protein